MISQTSSAPRRTLDRSAPSLQPANSLPPEISDDSRAALHRNFPSEAGSGPNFNATRQSQFAHLSKARTFNPVPSKFRDNNHVPNLPKNPIPRRNWIFLFPTRELAARLVGSSNGGRRRRFRRLPRRSGPAFTTSPTQRIVIAGKVDWSTFAPARARLAFPFSSSWVGRRLGNAVVGWDFAPVTLCFTTGT